MTTHYEDIKTILNRIDGVSNEAPTSNRQKLRAGMNHIENILNSIDDVNDLPETEMIIEDLVQFEKELSVIVSRNESGKNKKSQDAEYDGNPPGFCRRSAPKHTYPKESGESHGHDPS